MMDGQRLLGQRFLPSAQSAMNWVQGRPGSSVSLAMHLLGRAALIGVGLKAAGVQRNLLEKAVAGSLAIEVFVVLLAYWEES